MTPNQPYDLFEVHKEATLTKRYLPLSSIEPLLEKLGGTLTKQVLGTSVEKRPIHALQMGHGQKRILMWSQMHGNETTTTKVVFDLLNALDQNPQLNYLLEKLSIMIIPMLNPDGAEIYMRANANQIDLNRDAEKMTQPESRILREAFNQFKPDFCFNLHGQRTIFSAGSRPKPATLSFLAPAQDIERSVTATRKKAMEVIAVMDEFLQKHIPGQVGVYDDSFNINCVGDMFQSLGVPTLLFEAGHFPDDYLRNTTRKHLFGAMLIALDYISENEVTGEHSDGYFDIPDNQKLFFDVIVRNVEQKGNDVGIMYHEIYGNRELKFTPKIESIGDLKHQFGHQEFDAKGSLVDFGLDQDVKEGNEIDFVVVRGHKYSLKIENS